MSKTYIINFIIIIDRVGFHICHFDNCKKRNKIKIKIKQIPKHGDGVRQGEGETVIRRFLFYVLYECSGSHLFQQIMFIEVEVITAYKHTSLCDISTFFVFLCLFVVRIAKRDSQFNDTIQKLSLLDFSLFTVNSKMENVEHKGRVQRRWRC